MKPVPLLHRLAAQWRRQALWPESGAHVLVACSGGADSVFLLHALWFLREPFKLRLSVLSLDHGLRPEATADLRFVQQCAWRLGLPCWTETLAVPDHRQSGESVEMTARRLRRDALIRHAERLGADTVALGHHLDDQVETFFLKLARGTSARGAGGMNALCEVQGTRIFRPLLGISRAEIETFLRVQGLHWREDTSNRDTVHRRNLVRHEILPRLLQDLNPASVLHIAQFQELLREDEACLAELADRALASVLRDGQLDLSAWQSLPPALARRCLQRFAAGDDGPSTRVLYQHLASSPLQGSECLVVPSGTFFRRYGFLVRGVPEEALVVRVEESKGFDPGASHGNSVAFLDRARVLAAGPLRVRTVQPGERYREWHGRGHRKVADLLVDLKVPRDLRKRWPLITCAGEVVWVPGGRVAEGWQVRGPDAASLRLSLPGGLPQGARDSRAADSSQPRSEPD